MSYSRTIHKKHPRLNQLLKRKIDIFSLDALVNMATSAGMRVGLVIRPNDLHALLLMKTAHELNGVDIQHSPIPADRRFGLHFLSSFKATVWSFDDRKLVGASKVFK